MRGIFIFTLLISCSGFAQSSLQAKVQNGKPYLEHKVSQGEGLFSLGRQYEVQPKELAAFNALDLKTGLKKDQVIKVPMNTKALKNEPCDACTKVVYKVQPHEGLYRIGINFGNKSLAELKKLNGLNTDVVSIGQQLIVGYLKGKEGSQPEMVTDVNTPKEVPHPAKDTIKTNNGAIEKEQPVRPVEPQVLDNKMTERTMDRAETQRSAFMLQYTGKDQRSHTGTAAIFRTISGWDDAKYYVLMDDVEPGTIVRVIATATNKAIYAKVLGPLPQIKQNEGILVRISNAALAALGGGEENMEVVVNH